jgi:hypothetical protein
MGPSGLGIEPGAGERIGHRRAAGGFLQLRRIAQRELQAAEAVGPDRHGCVQNAAQRGQLTHPHGDLDARLETFGARFARLAVMAPDRGQHQLRGLQVARLHPRLGHARKDALHRCRDALHGVCRRVGAFLSAHPQQGHVGRGLGPPFAGDRDRGHHRLSLRRRDAGRASQGHHDSERRRLYKSRHSAVG